MDPYIKWYLAVVTVLYVPIVVYCWAEKRRERINRKAVPCPYSKPESWGSH